MSAISNSLSAVSFAPNFSSRAPATRQPAPQTTSLPADTVTLTVAQQVYNLYNQGQSVPQIASGLNLTVDMVNNFLSIAAPPQGTKS